MMYILFATMEDLKQKKLNFFTSLPSVMTMTLGKARNLRHSASQLCRVPWARHSAKKIKKTALPSAYLQHSAKKIQKKGNKLCRVPDSGTRQSIFLKNEKHISLSSALTMALGKAGKLSVPDSQLC